VLARIFFDAIFCPRRSIRGYFIAQYG
jgi:hypothetical protein